MTKSFCVWYWLIFLPYVCPFLKKFLLDDILFDFVNKTSLNKAGANEKRKRIPSDVTLSRNDPTAGYDYFVNGSLDIQCLRNRGSLYVIKDD